MRIRLLLFDGLGEPADAYGFPYGEDADNSEAFQFQGGGQGSIFPPNGEAELV